MDLKVWSHRQLFRNRPFVSEAFDSEKNVIFYIIQKKINVI